MSDKLNLEPNQPEVIALEWTQGRPVVSKFGGSQIMFSLTDGRKWFAPPTVAAKVEALQPAKGEPISVCKREAANKSIYYEVERYQPAPVVEKPRPLSPQRVEAPRTETTKSQVAPQQAQVSSIPEDVARYMQALRDARLILFRDQEESRDTQFTIEYGPEDVRSVAAALFIERNKWRPS